MISKYAADLNYTVLPVLFPRDQYRLTEHLYMGVQKACGENSDAGRNKKIRLVSYFMYIEYVTFIIN